MLKLCISSFKIVKITGTSGTRCQKKVDTKENARVIGMCTFSGTQEITNSSSNGSQTVPWVEKCPKTSVYACEQSSLFLCTS